MCWYLTKSITDFFYHKAVDFIPFTYLRARERFANPKVKGIFGG